MPVIPPQRSELRTNLNEGSVSCGFNPQAAQELQREISQLMQDIKAVAQSTTGWRQTSSLQTYGVSIYGGSFSRNFL